ncbi:MAG TPA: GPR1/FUN34/YaaH family transporter [Terriglobia bacterium]|nr:GPR1/FUN34/YaaH family transporter [Terriglobia bacterium]
MTNTVIPMPETREDQRTPANIYLQPIAAPSILGLYGLAGATFMVAAHMAHWFGNGSTDLYLAPFAVMCGGLAQFLAGMWTYKARDGVATAMHGMWGAFWISWGVLNLAFARGVLAQPQGSFPALGYWFLALAAITWAGMAAAGSKLLATVLGFLAAGSTIAAIANFAGSDGANILAGYLLIASALLVYFAASGLMLRTRRSEDSSDVVLGTGEPGVIRGQ